MQIEREVAYLLGAMRDSTIDFREGKNYEIKIAQKNSEWLTVLQDIFLRHFGNAGKITKHVNNTAILRVNGKEIVRKLLELSEMKIPQENWDTPNIIKKQRSEIQMHYVRGFFDAEGGLPKNPATATQRYISFSQKNRESLEFIRDFLLGRGYKPTNITFCGGVWEFRLTRKINLVKFSQEIGSLHSDKRQRLSVLERVYSPLIGGGALPGVEAAV